VAINTSDTGRIRLIWTKYEFEIGRWVAIKQGNYLQNGEDGIGVSLIKTGISGIVERSQLAN